MSKILTIVVPLLTFAGWLLFGLAIAHITRPLIDGLAQTNSIRRYALENGCYCNVKYKMQCSQKEESLDAMEGEE